MKTWFTSDLHFGHKNILKFSPDTRPYSDIEDMHENMIRTWNETVAPTDTVYILGDVSFMKLEPTVAILKSLNGMKILVTGNHDEKLVREKEFRDCFIEIKSYIYRKVEDVKIAMFHFPIYEWNSMHHGAYHLFGHVHGKPVPVPGRCLDIGWDAHARLLSVADIKDILERKPIRAHGAGEY